MQSTSKTTCSDTTSPTDRATVITGLRSDGRPATAHQPLRRFIHRTGHPVTVSPRPTGAPSTDRPQACLVGLGRSPVSNPLALRPHLDPKRNAAWTTNESGGSETVID